MKLADVNTILVFPVMISAIYVTVILATNIGIENASPTYSDEILLKEHILKNYSKNVRPVINLSSTVEINAFLFLHTLYDLDFVNNFVQAHYYFGLKWIDEMLTWDPLEYNNITNIYLPQDTVWTPSIIMCNSMKESKDDGKHPELFINHKGLVVMWSFRLLHTYCQVNAYAYPFDEHKCEIFMCVSVHEYIHTRINTLLSDDLKFNQNFKWDINCSSRVNASREKTFSYVSAPIHIKRKLTVAIIAMLIPTIMMTILTIFVFLLPPESGEKVSLATTIFLSNVLYLVQIDKTTPKNSKYPSLLMLYLMLLSMLSGVATLGSVVISKLYIIQSPNIKNASKPPDQPICKSQSNKVADISILSQSTSDAADDKEAPNIKRRFCIFNYERVDSIFLKISLGTCMIISILFTCLFFTPSD